LGFLPQPKNRVKDAIPNSAEGGKKKEASKKNRKKFRRKYNPSKSRKKGRLGKRGKKMLCRTKGCGFGCFKRS